MTQATLITRKSRTSQLLTASLLLAACASHQSMASSSTMTRPAIETRWFAFHSNPWVNLHHFLYLTARARMRLDGARPASTAVLDDTVGYDRLSREQRADWEAALGYYSQFVAKRDILFDSSLVDVNNRLTLLEHGASVRGTPGLDSGIAGALDRAAPIYRALWWPRHDASNRRWIAGVVPLLDVHGEAAVREEVRLFHREWPRTPVRVDVSAYTNWAGAYTTENPSHINVSSTDPDNRGPASFESLFHEVLHTMDDSVFTALVTAFRAQKKRFYRDPTHPFIFYTAGELTRRAFPGYVPFAETAGLWTRNSDYSKILPMLREYWQPYLDGKSSLGEAMRHIAEAW